MEEIDRKYSGEKRSLSSFQTPAEMWLFAKEHVENFRWKEMRSAYSRILRRNRKGFSEYEFLQEYLWCVYVSGFSAATVSDKYKRLLVAHGIEDPQGRYTPAVLGKRTDIGEALKIINNPRKAKAIQNTKQAMETLGWVAFKKKYLTKLDPEKIQGLEFIGPALSCHLARNLGNLSVVKPDVHLGRLAARHGFKSVDEMCRNIGARMLTSAWVDLVLWYASVDHGTGA